MELLSSFQSSVLNFSSTPFAICSVIYSFQLESSLGSSQ
jgi:hypothetical protein